jgi:tetrahydromethanopterin S-methyltransferase subunit C
MSFLPDSPKFMARLGAVLVLLAIADTVRLVAQGENGHHRTSANALLLDVFFIVVGLGVAISPWLRRQKFPWLAFVPSSAFGLGGLAYGAYALAAGIHNGEATPIVFGAAIIVASLWFCCLIVRGARNVRKYGLDGSRPEEVRTDS